MRIFAKLNSQFGMVGLFPRFANELIGTSATI